MSVATVSRAVAGGDNPQELQVRSCPLSLDRATYYRQHDENPRSMSLATAVGIPSRARYFTRAAHESNEDPVYFRKYHWLPTLRAYFHPSLTSQRAALAIPFFF